MTDFWQRLKQRKLVQWAVAYIAAAFALLQGIDIVAQQFGWPEGLQRGITLALVLGFFVVLVLAWYHGERGEQKVSGVELIILAAVLAVGGGFMWRYSQTSQPDASTSVATTALGQPAPGKPGAEPTSIAVLPFVDLSQAHDQEYFSDGLSEELLNQLAQLPQLRVIARTSSFSFKDKEVGIATIASKLNVANILEGSVRKDGTKLRVAAQLIRASDSSQLWSQTYDRELTDVFEVQDEIAGAVVTALKLKLLPTQRIDSAQRTTNTDAYNQYLLGNQYYSRGSPEDWRRAEEAYRQAIALDPGYAAAYAGLAGAQYSLVDLTSDPAGRREALATADRAVTMAPQLSDGYAARGVTRLSFFRDWAGAQSDFDKALALNPGDSNIQSSYYRLLMALGRVPESIDTARKATELDPLSAIAWVGLGRALHAAGQYPAARKAIEHGLEISPDSDVANYQLGKNYLMQGNPSDALIAFQRSGGGYRMTGIAMAEYSLGHDALSLQALEQEIGKDHRAAYQIAEAYAWRGQKDKAFEWLDRAIALNDGGLSFLKSDPLMASLVTDPRYATLLKKMGLPE